MDDYNSSDIPNNKSSTLETRFDSLHCAVYSCVALAISSGTFPTKNGKRRELGGVVVFYVHSFWVHVVLHPLNSNFCFSFNLFFIILTILSLFSNTVSVFLAHMLHVFLRLFPVMFMVVLQCFSIFLHVLFFIVALLTRYIALFVENHMFRTVPFPCHCYISQGNTFKMI